MADIKKKPIPEDIQKLLKTVYDDCMKEDSAVRERQIRQWKRLKLLWEGFSRIWYSEVAHDWRIADDVLNQNDDQAYYDRPINVFKAYLESIIAALSVTVPPVKCFPDDADNTLDLATARAGDKISQLIYRHNDAGLLWLHMLFIHMTEGMVAVYSYPDYDEKYGTYEENKYEELEEQKEFYACPLCGNELSEKDNELRDQQQDKFNPDNFDAELNNIIENENLELCEACSQLVKPELKTETFITTRLVGKTKQPKGRICIESYGGLYVKISNYSKKQSKLPYLILSYEEDYSLIVEEFEHLHNNPNLIKSIQATEGSYEDYAQWGRLSPQYQGEYPENVVTKNCAWIRPAKFNVLKDKDDIKKLKNLYPNGVKVIIVNGEFADACNESLDDRWTLTENPLADYLHFDPTGQSLVSVQEITNDLISLVLQTIEHGIGQTFADPSVLNFPAYEQTSVTPGGIFPAKAKSGGTLEQGFKELRTATLSPEVMPFSTNIQSLGQLASGATPSIFGGQVSGVGGETASGYSMSRAQALQRLQNTWKLFTIVWKTTFGKVVPMYIDIAKKSSEDERDVQRDDDGNFVNVLIRKAELEGKIGKVELEANENLPLTWTQKKDLLFTLLQSTSPEIMKILNAPENLALIHESLGLVDFYVPGEDDVIKQYDEIKLLLNSEPIEEPPDEAMMLEAIETGVQAEPIKMPSVEIDPIYDNHEIEFGICRKWIISEAGRQAKTTNPAGYENVLLHGRMHFMEIQKMLQAEQMMQAKPSQGDGATPSERPDKTKQEAPIMGEADVQTVS